MFSSDKMDIHAAEKFWSEFSGKEEWIINGLSKNPLTVVDFVDALIKPVFPYFKRELEFQLGFNDGVGEFFFYHLDNASLIRDSQTLKDMMPDELKEHWKFIIEP